MSKKKNPLPLIKSYITPIFCLVGIIFLQNLHLNKVNAAKIANYSREEQSAKVILDAQKNMPSFGFKNLVANWNFLKFIQYFGDGEARQQTGYSLIPDYFEIMVKQDPRFIKAYISLSSANSIYAAQPDKSVTLMNEVLKSISPDISPLAHYIWIYKGVDEILFLGDLKAAQHSYEMAAKWASLQGEEVTAARARETAQFLANNPDSKKAQISAWTTILSNARDEKTQQRAIEEIKALGAQIKITPQGEMQIKLPEAI